MSHRSLWLLVALASCVDPIVVDELPPAALDADRDGWDITADCDDANPARNPARVERCNGLDDDCDGATDEQAVDQGRWFADADGDGHGDPTQPIRACLAVPDRVTVGDDCDDRDPAVFPGAEERCNGRDDDCDAQVDDGEPPSSWFADVDRDGWGAGDGTIACEGPPGWVDRDGDCAPDDPERHPAAIEVCDGVDQDCDSRVDDDAADATAWFDDADADGHGDPATKEALCGPPGDGRITQGDDCDDSRDDVHPGRPEVCDTVDQDCDEDIDEQPIDGDPWYDDVDGDGWGDAEAFVLACDPVPDATATAEDCDDTDGTIYPGAPEVDDDGVDQDCDDADPSGVAWAGIADPCDDVDAALGDAFTAAADVHRPGDTDAVGCGSALTGQLGVGPDGTDPATSAAWTWTDGECVGDADHGALGADSLDRWSATTTLATAGDLAFAWRFRYRLTWVLADRGEACGEAGSDDGATDFPVVSVVDQDVDDDGYDTTDDCDDTDPDIHPGAAEDPTNGVDDDCDGSTDEYVFIDDVAVGDLVITEFMYDPSASSDDDGEWIEVYNAGTEAIDLDGLVIRSTSGSSTERETVSSPGLYVLAGQYLALGRTTDTATNGDTPVSYGWGVRFSDLSLKNTGTDLIALDNASDTLDELTYDLGGASVWPAKSSGRSFALDATALDATSNDDGANWCRASTVYGDGDQGTPGEENDC